MRRARPWAARAAAGGACCGAEREPSERRGFELGGVHSVRDEEHAIAPPSHGPYGGFGAPAAARGRMASSSVAQELGDLDLLPKKCVTTRVQVE